MDRLGERGACGRCFDRGSVGGSVALVRRPGELGPRFVDLGRATAQREGSRRARRSIDRRACPTSSSIRSSARASGIATASPTRRPTLATVDALGRGLKRPPTCLRPQDVGLVEGRSAARADRSWGRGGAARSAAPRRLRGVPRAPALVRRVGLFELREGRILERDSPAVYAARGDCSSSARTAWWWTRTSSSRANSTRRSNAAHVSKASWRRVASRSAPAASTSAAARAFARPSVNGIASDTSTVWPSSSPSVSGPARTRSEDPPKPRARSGRARAIEGRGCRGDGRIVGQHEADQLLAIENGAEVVLGMRREDEPQRDVRGKHDESSVGVGWVQPRAPAAHVRADSDQERSMEEEQGDGRPSRIVRATDRSGLDPGGTALSSAGAASGVAATTEGLGVPSVASVVFPTVGAAEMAHSPCGQHVISFWSAGRSGSASRPFCRSQQQCTAKVPIAHVTSDASGAGRRRRVP
jgi:hypothetical protein